jgi:hypothetical protein
MKKIMQFLSKLLPKSEADKLTIELTKTGTLPDSKQKFIKLSDIHRKLANDLAVRCTSYINCDKADCCLTDIETNLALSEEFRAKAIQFNSNDSEA